MIGFVLLRYYLTFIIIIKHNSFFFDFKCRSFCSYLIGQTNCKNFNHTLTNTILSLVLSDFEFFREKLMKIVVQNFLFDIIKQGHDFKY